MFFIMVRRLAFGISGSSRCFVGYGTPRQHGRRAALNAAAGYCNWQAFAGRPAPTTPLSCGACLISGASWPASRRSFGSKGLDREVDIPPGAVAVSFTTSQGPGGQNVNKVSSFCADGTQPCLPLFNKKDKK